jgi:hypothetical protein
MSREPQGRDDRTAETRRVLSTTGPPTPCPQLLVLPLGRGDPGTLDLVPESPRFAVSGQKDEAPASFRGRFRFRRRTEMVVGWSPPRGSTTDDTHTLGPAIETQTLSRSACCLLALIA